jgi:hypothetical protein
MLYNCLACYLCMCSALHKVDKKKKHHVYVEARPKLIYYYINTHTFYTNNSIHDTDYILSNRNRSKLYLFIYNTTRTCCSSSSYMLITKKKKKKKKKALASNTCMLTLVIYTDIFETQERTNNDATK